METGKVFRLMELFNIKIESKTDSIVTAKFPANPMKTYEKSKSN